MHRIQWPPPNARTYKLQAITTFLEANARCNSTNSEVTSPLSSKTETFCLLTVPKATCTHLSASRCCYVWLQTWEKTRHRSPDRAVAIGNVCQHLQIKGEQQTSSTVDAISKHKHFKIRLKMCLLGRQLKSPRKCRKWKRWGRRRSEWDDGGWVVMVWRECWDTGLLLLLSKGLSCGIRQAASHLVHTPFEAHCFACIAAHLRGL